MSFRVMMYSFKGGAGRTVTTANVAYALATEYGKRVVVIDLDVESAGASVLFDVDGKVEKDEGPVAVQDMLRGGPVLRDDFRDVWGRAARAFAPNDVPVPNLRLLPARRILRTADEVPFGSINVQRDFQLLLRQIQRVERPDFIFIDSASGIQQSALMGLANADVLVIFSRWTRQFLAGTRQFIHQQIIQNETPPPLRRILLVPTAVPRSSAGSAVYLKKSREDLEAFVNMKNADAVRPYQTRSLISLFDDIPESDLLKWDDRIMTGEVIKAHSRDASVNAVVEAYRRLAAHLVELTEETRQ